MKREQQLISLIVNKLNVRICKWFQSLGCTSDDGVDLKLYDMHEKVTLFREED